MQIGGILKGESIVVITSIIVAAANRSKERISMAGSALRNVELSGIPS